MAKDYLRLKRGMVFQYNIDTSIDKFNIPKIRLDSGKEIDDHLQYGYRDFLVISNDENNAFSPTCNIIPITTSNTKSDLPTHVHFNFLGEKLTILCEHVYTVNSQTVYKYKYTLSDEIMSKVEDALAIQFNIKRSSYDKTIKMSLDQVETIIQGIINKKVEEATKLKKANEVDIEDAVLRLGEGLMTLFEETSPVTTTLKVEDTIVSTPIAIEGVVNKNKSVISVSNSPEKDKPQSQVDKFYSRYPDLKKPSQAPKTIDKENKESTTKKARKKRGEYSSKPRRSWTTESMQQFMEDANRLSPMEMVKNYNFKDNSDYFKVRYYVQNRLAGRI